jgi:hypothetical protein
LNCRLTAGILVCCDDEDNHHQASCGSKAKHHWGADDGKITKEALLSKYFFFSANSGFLASLNCPGELYSARNGPRMTWRARAAAEF